MKTILNDYTIAFFLVISGIGDVFGQNMDYLAKAPFYKNYKNLQIGSTGVSHLPIGLDKQLNEEFFYTDRIAPMSLLLDEMNVYLDSICSQSSLLTDSDLNSSRPYLFVGSSEAVTAPGGSEMMRLEHHKYPPMIIYLKKPSKIWKEEIRRTLKLGEFEYLMIISLGLTEYPKANKGIFKKKVVLGTDYEREIRFFSAEDKPVEVLQFTGIMVNRDGEVIRAGAEGIIHEDTPFWAQIFNIEKGIDDQAIGKLLMDYKREEIPGQPPAWRVALKNLIRQLTLKVS